MRKRITYGKTAVRPSATFDFSLDESDEHNLNQPSNPQTQGSTRTERRSTRNKIPWTGSNSSLATVGSVQSRNPRLNRDIGSGTTEKVFDISISEDESLSSETSSPRPSTISSSLSSYSTPRNNLKRKRTRQIERIHPTNKSSSEEEIHAADTPDNPVSNLPIDVPAQLQHSVKQRIPKIIRSKRSVLPSRPARAFELRSSSIGTLSAALVDKPVQAQTWGAAAEVGSNGSSQPLNVNGEVCDSPSHRSAEVSEDAPLFARHHNDRDFTEQNFRKLRHVSQKSSSSAWSQSETQKAEDAAQGPQTPKAASQKLSSTQNRLSRTPKERQQWSRLLSEEPSESPSTVMRKLSIASSMGSYSETPNLLRSKNRLVDALKRAETRSASPEDFGSRNDDVSNGVDRHASLARPEFSDETTSKPVSRVSHVKITYAKQRSYVADAPSDLEDNLKHPLDYLLVPEQNAMDVEESENEDAVNGMRNIHELRAAGDSERFSNSVNSFLEDLSTPSRSALSLRRSAMMRLTLKLSDDDFLKHMTHDGYDAVILNQSDPENDIIFVYAMTAAALYMLSNGPEDRISDSIYESGLLNRLEGLLQHTTRISVIAKQRRTNMSRSNQELVQQLQVHIQALISSSLPTLDANPQVIALKLIEHVVRKRRENGNLDMNLNRPIVDKLLSILKTASEFDNIGSDATAALVLSTLESFTVAAASAVAIWNTTMIDRFTDATARFAKSKVDVFRKYSSLIFRICLNLSNNNEVNAEAFARPDFVDPLLTVILEGVNVLSRAQSDSQDLMQYDNLILALGATINLAEMSAKVKDVLYWNSTKQLQQILDAFVMHQSQASQAQSLGQSRANVAYGYVAVLASNLCIDEQIRRIIRDRLPGKKLNALIEAVDEFVLYHQVADKKEEGNKHWTAFTQRLQTLADVLRALET